MRETATSESPPPRAGTRRVFAVASEKTTSSGSFDVREDRGGKSLPTNRATRQLCPSLLESGLGSIIEDTAVDCSSLTKQRHLTDTAPATGDEADTRSSLSLASALVVRSALESPASEGTPPLDAEAGPTKNRTSSSRRLYGAFCLILLLEVFVNFDSGVVPAVLVSLEREFHFDGSLEGVLGALPYIGLVVSSPFVGRGLTLFSPKWFCFASMLGNVFSTALLGLAKQRWLLFLARFLIGLTQAAFCIYAPVWVDSFSPPQCLTLWMGLTQGGVVIGTILGCLTAGALDAANESGLRSFHWRQALLVQCCGLFLLIVAWALTSSDALDVASVHAQTQLLGDAGGTPGSEFQRSFEAEEQPATGGEEKEEKEEKEEMKENDELRGQTSSDPQRVVQLRELEVVASSNADLPKAAKKDTSTCSGRRTSLSSLSQRTRLGSAFNSGRLNSRMSHRASALHLELVSAHCAVAQEYLRDPLANFLPVQFFQASERRSTRNSLVLQSQPAEGALVDDALQEGRRGSSLSPTSATRASQLQHFQREQQRQAEGRAQRAFTVGAAFGGPRRNLNAGGSNAGIAMEGFTYSLTGPMRRRATVLAYAGNGLEEKAEGSGPTCNSRYQVTFLSATPTTLACEALNWAAGINNPLLLARTAAPSAHQTFQGPTAASSSSAPTTNMSRFQLSPAEEAAFCRQTTPAPESSTVCTLQTQTPPAHVDFGERVGVAGAGEEDKGFCREAPVDDSALQYGVTKSIKLLVGSVNALRCNREPNVRVADSPRLINPLYVCVTISLCALFFEVTAIQFWSIKYFQQVMKHSQGTVLIAFNATAATAPILGVLCGGWSFDRLGGYKTASGLRRSLLLLLLLAIFCCACGTGAAVSAALTARAKNRQGTLSEDAGFACLVLSVWLMMFAGAAALPAAAGVVIAAVPARARAFGSGFCMMVYSIFGYVLGAFLPGVFIQVVGLEAAMRIVYMWSIFGVLGFGGGLFVVRHLNINPMIMENADVDLTHDT